MPRGPGCSAIDHALARCAPPPRAPHARCTIQALFLLRADLGACSRVVHCGCRSAATVMFALINTALRAFIAVRRKPETSLAIAAHAGGAGRDVFCARDGAAATRSSPSAARAARLPSGAWPVRFCTDQTAAVARQYMLLSTCPVHGPWTAGAGRRGWAKSSQLMPCCIDRRSRSALGEEVVRQRRGRQLSDCRRSRVRRDGRLAAAQRQCTVGADGGGHAFILSLRIKVT